MPPAAITADMPDLPSCSSSMASRYSNLRGVRWRINLGILPNSLSSTIDDLRRISADHRRKYAALRRHLLVDPQVTKFSDDSSNLVVDNPLSQNPDSTWGRFFRSAELEQMVDQDLSRLYPEHGSYFQTQGCQRLLRRILLLWCLRHPECGYRQGMHELLAPLLYVLHADIQHFNEVRKLYEEHFIDKFDEVLFHENLDFNFKISTKTLENDKNPKDQYNKHTTLSDLDTDIQTIVLLNDPYGAEGELGILLSEKFLEHDAYSMFDALMSGSGGALSMAEFFSHPPSSSTQTGLPPVIEASMSLYHLLSIVDSSLYNHLVELGVEPQYFALRWLRVLFGREFSLEDLLVIWDEIFSFDNNQITTIGNDFGVVNSHRGAFISSMAVSMMLNVRSSLLASEYATSCLQRLLNFPKNVNLEKLVEKAKSLVPLALTTNVPSYSPLGNGYSSKQKGLKSHAHSLSLDSSSPKIPSSFVPERYWEEKWRVAQEEKAKNEIITKLASPRKKGWTEKIKSRLSRTESEPSPLKKENIYRDKRSVRRSLLEDLSRQLKFGEGSEELGHDDKLSRLLDPPFVESNNLNQNIENENGTSIEDDSENYSKKSIIDGGTHDSSFEPVIEESTRSISDPLDGDSNGQSVSNNCSKEILASISKERKSLSGKFQWFWKFGRHSFSEGSLISNESQEVEEVKLDDEDNVDSNKDGFFVDEMKCNNVDVKTDGCDQNLLSTLRNLGQSMLENIQVIELAFQQEKSPPGSIDHLSKHALVEKGQVTAITALKELRKISNLLHEM